MNRLVATKSADRKFHNIHALGFASYVGAVRSLLMSSQRSAAIVTPFMDESGLALLCDAWDASPKRDRTWSIFIRNVDGELTAEARKRDWRLYSYEQSPRSENGHGLHAKLVSVDGRRAVIGSMNLIERNLHSNLELGVELEDPNMIWRIGRLVRAFGRVCDLVE